jgi:tetratricopeptide (TPR) repeat protein
VAAGRRQRPYFLIAFTTLGVGLLAAAGYFVWQKYFNYPDPPSVNLTGLDQEIIDAVENARKAVREQPRSANAWGRLGAVLRAHEFLEAANFCFAQAEGLDPDNYRWPYAIALDQLTGFRDAALVRLRRAVSLCGDEAAPRLRLAEVLLEGGEVAEAEALFRWALRKKGLDNARAHLGLGKAALERNDLAGALEHLRSTIAGAPGSKEAHALLAQVYRRRGDAKAAEQELRLLPRLVENSSAWPDPVRDYIGGLWTGIRARMTRINTYDQQGQREEAVVAARDAVRVYPKKALTHLVLGEMLNKIGNTRAAEPALREALRLDPKRGKTYFELGYALQSFGKYQEAADNYRIVLRTQPDLAVAHFNLGMCLEKLKDLAGAMKEYRAAIRYNANYTQAYIAVAWLLGHQDRYQEARALLDEAARVAEPGDTRPQQLLKELRDHLTELTRKHMEAAVFWWLRI